MTEQRSTRNRAEDKLETLKMYRTRYTRLDSQMLHLDVTEKDMTENLTRTLTAKPITIPAHEIPAVEMPKYRRVEVHHQNTLWETRHNIGDSPQLSEGEGGSISEPLYTELVDPEPTPNEPPELKVLPTRMRRERVRLGTTYDPIQEEMFRLIELLF